MPCKHYNDGYCRYWECECEYVDAVDACDYFEVDDVMAPVIQTLNRKGYRTAFCCAGHPFVGYAPTYNENGEVAGHLQFYSADLYIAFAKGVRLPPKQIPEFMQWSRGLDGIEDLHKDMGELNTYSFFREQCQTMEQLAVWAESLPIKIVVGRRGVQ